MLVGQYGDLIEEGGFLDDYERVLAWGGAILFSAIMLLGLPLICLLKTGFEWRVLSLYAMFTILCILAWRKIETGSFRDLGVSWQPLVVGGAGLVLSRGGCLLHKALGLQSQADPVAEALDKLRRGHPVQQVYAANQLTQLRPDDRREEVAHALQPLLANPHMGMQEAAARAVIVWGTAENVPALIPLTSHADWPTRLAALRALGRLRDARGAEAAAGRLPEMKDRIAAIKALKSMGPAAETAVLPYLRHADWGVRLEACKILAVLGTKKSIPALQAAEKEESIYVRSEATKALAAVSARP